MKSEKILRALGEIDDRLVLDIIPASAQPKKKRWPTILMAAAMLSICMFGAYKLGFIGLTIKEAVPSTQETVSTAEETQETELHEEREPQAEALAKLTVNSTYMGDGTDVLYVNDLSELAAGTEFDLSELPETMPVYANFYHTDELWLPDTWVPDAEAMEGFLLQAAEKFGVSGSVQRNMQEDICFSVSLETEDTSLRLSCDMVLSVFYHAPVVMPEGCGSRSRAEAENAAVFLLEFFEPLLGMEEPKAALMYENGVNYEVILYDAAGTLQEQLKSWGFGSIRCMIYDDCLQGLQISCKDVSEVEGEYPILMPDEAQSLWADGYGMTSAYGEPLEIVETTLVYEPWTWMDHYMPYYRFLVAMLPEEEREQEIYGVYYLPAIRPEYLTELPRWKLEEAAVETPDGWVFYEETVTEDKLLSMVVPLEIAMGKCGEFTFSENGLTNDQLFMAFMALSNPEELVQYLDKEGVFYHIPEEAVTEKLADYFSGFIFYASEGMNYDLKQFDETVSWVRNVQITGNRYARVLSIEIEGTVVSFTVGYYSNPERQDVPYLEKEYMIEFYDGGYLFLDASIVAENAELLYAQPGLQEAADVSEDALLEMVRGLEVAMTNQGFTFRNACELGEDDLYTLFLVLADYQTELMPCYDAETEQFSFSEELIHSVLSRHFLGYSFDITKARGFDSERGEVVTYNASGFGGDMPMQLLNKTVLDNCVVFEVGFYGDYNMMNEPYAVKEYTVAFYGGGWYFLSAIYR